MGLITSHGARATCPVCGTRRSACGGPSTHTPVDDPIHTTGKGTIMTEPQNLSEYEYEVYGNTVTGQLTDADAKRLNARPVGAAAEGDASGQAADESGDAEPKASKARKPQNKAE